ncbi:MULTISPECIES: DUF4153 domain-containing protein [Mameliella]|uniref:DUF4153 domain-containing protein n=1 Tax=Mameliella TaxID=1434019 RepID=UPI000B5360D7|nr:MULTISPECIES: DUF4173 domain-containing protein [Mameliella]MCR9274418.1 DUF4173 domain-containing protein [Paracoccaceae bacterium]OWV63096.1 hypothetical protein CDZ98_02705 [Mameliella alba]
MDRQLSIPGLPHALARDGWWLDEGAAPPAQGDGGSGPAGVRFPRRLAAVLTLVALADFLFWGRVPGLSVVIFAAAILAWGLQGAGAWRRPAGLFLVAALPAVDHLQPLSLAFLLVGLGGALTWAHHPAAPIAALSSATGAFLGRLPVAWLAQLDPRRLFALPAALAEAPVPLVRKVLRDWALPLGGALVLVALLMQANPVLAQLVQIDLDLWQLAQRLVFWGGIAVLVGPFLAPVPPCDRVTRGLVIPSIAPGWLNPGSVLRGLAVFNLLIAVQSLTDVSILLGGADLPEGMTLAEYAHRGAYPLLAAAVLAGAFALAVRPFLGEHRLIRPLLLLWLMQNMVLCGAAALRLDLYIETFGLTYLRLHALIWMALVAAGLGLALWQVLRARSNRWLLVRGGVLGLATLYLCAMVNFAQVIAAQNVTRAEPDLWYLCGLGPMAAGPIVESGLGRVTGRSVQLGPCRITRPEVEDWRGWGFRSWRASRYVQGVMVERP